MSGINIENIIAIAVNAGKAILKIYEEDDFSVEAKSDNSPLTKADKAANEIIVAALKDNYPQIPIISEENKTVPFEERKNWNQFWLVDPLDGTKEFIKRNGEFTVNIALIENGTPVAGVVHVPVTGVTYYSSKEAGAFKEENGKIGKLENSVIHYTGKQHIKVVASRSHLSDETKEFVSELEKKGKHIEFVFHGQFFKIVFSSRRYCRCLSPFRTHYGVGYCSRTCRCRSCRKKSADS
jgi:3'(2'), 5'-bisphosphate nucleotidase